MIGAVLRGMDLVALGNYSGNATKAGSDATMAIIAREGSGIVKGDLASLKGKKIAASFGTINHLYILALLEKAGLKPDDVTLVNTPPPDMTVALLAKGIDAFSGWDPWPIVAHQGCAGRGSRSSAAATRSPISASTSRCGPGSRKTAKQSRNSSPAFRKPINGCARIRSRPHRLPPAGFPGLKPEIAEAAMQFNVQQADRRLSANNYRALWSAEDRLNRLGILKSTFDVNKHIEPKYILKVMKDNPELFTDLPPIPSDVTIGPGFVFRP